MKYDPEICGLIIRNLALLNEAQAALEYINDEVYEKIWRFIKDQTAREKSVWKWKQTRMAGSIFS